MKRFIKIGLFCSLIGIGNQFFLFGSNDNIIREGIKNNNSDLIDEKSFDELVEENDVEEGLQKKIREYQEMIVNEEDILRINQLNLLIDTTENILEEYRQSINSPMPYDNENGGNFFVGTYINAFSTLGYDLAAELLTISAAKGTHKEMIYKPIYGSRIISSSVTYSIAENTLISGHDTFVKTNTTYGNDLYYSIHNFKFEKESSNSKSIKITDTYDYDYIENATEFEDKVVNIVAKAMENSEISPFDIEINVNIKESYKLSILEKNQNNMKVRIENITDMDRLTFYNSKTVSRTQAENWSNLTRIEYVNIPKNSFIDVDVEIMTTSDGEVYTHFPVSYIDYHYRYVTIGEGVLLCGQMGESTNKVRYFDYGHVEFLGRNHATYIFKVINIYGVEVQVEYNKKFCTHEEAVDWKNLQEIESFPLNAGASSIIEVETTYHDSSDVAIRFISESLETRVAVYNISLEDGSMMFEENTFKNYKYLEIHNNGKNGNKWKISVKNPFSRGLWINYNSKMCFEDDAKNWKNLNDVEYLYIEGNQIANIEIQENWFATSIALSYLFEPDDKRIITYANNLNSNGSMNIMYNYIKF